MADRLVRTSKFMSYVLRHNPDALGLELEPGGWADLDTLIERARTQGRSLDRALLNRVIAQSDNDRFTIIEDGSRIRANYGHSIEVDLDLTPTSPPPTLYHGTATRTLYSIRQDGLRPQSRQYVHLSSTREEATRVGARHGSPVVLVVEAQALHDAGHSLYRSSEAVWLTDRVPPSFLDVPDR